MNAAISALDDFYRQFGDPERVNMSLTPRAPLSPCVNVEISARDEDILRAHLEDAARSAAIDDSDRPWNFPIDDELRTGAAAILQDLRDIGHIG